MKFNKEERKAIIRKLTNIANERTNASLKLLKESYVPSVEYVRIKELVMQRNAITEELQKCGVLNSWHVILDVNTMVNKIRNKEIEPFVERYKVDETDLEVELILMDKKDSIDEVIEHLLNQVLVK